MIRLMFIFLYLAYVVQATSTNTTNTNCPPLDGTSRSVWSILGNCGMTLLICVWQAIHPDVPSLQSQFVEVMREGVLFILGAFFVPEVMVAIAAKQWWDARDKVLQFRERKYEWSMTHSYFAEMNGFLYCDNEGNRRAINSLEFLRLCEAGEIANPVVTVKEIKDRSKSDALGKAIFALQLFWFMLHVSVRDSHGLAITLVELDTLCMAVLTLLALFFWWDRPLRPKCPHTFYSHEKVNLYSQMVSPLSNAWKSEPSYLHMIIPRLVRTRKTHWQLIAGGEETVLVVTDDNAVYNIWNKLTTIIGEMDGYDFRRVSFCVTWVVLGALHLTAWNFYFPTKTEKIIWRVASLVLTGGPLAAIAVAGLACILKSVGWYKGNAKQGVRVILFYSFPFSVVCRALLVALMLAGLRDLPCSVHQNVQWSIHIPHL